VYLKEMRAIENYVTSSRGEIWQHIDEQQHSTTTKMWDKQVSLSFVLCVVADEEGDEKREIEDDDCDECNIDGCRL
jgi:hypothetical protein